MGPVRTIQERCRKCYACIRNCPVKAVRVTEHWTEVIHPRCIACGKCIEICPQQAKVAVGSINETRRLLSGKDPVVAVLGGSYPTFAQGIRPNQLVAGLKQLGFDEVHEGAGGVELLSVPYRQFIETQAQGPLITSHCPAVVALVEKHYPRLVKNLVPLVSPMVAIGRFIKTRKGDKTKVVYLSSCVARKLEIESDPVADAVDTILTYQELDRLFTEHDIHPRELADQPFAGFPPHRGRFFALSGGPFHAFGIENNLAGPEYLFTDGEKNTLEVIRELSAGKISPKVVDVRFCNGGCIGRPECGNRPRAFSKQQTLHHYCRNQKPCYQTADHYLYDQTLPELQRRFSKQNYRLAMPNQKKIRQILDSSFKFTERDELDCGLCGYGSCREQAVAVAQGLAETDMCAAYARKRLTSDYTVLAQKYEATRQALRREYGDAEIIGRDQQTLEVLNLIEQVAPTTTTILIRGESGTGKELTARAIHRQSRRADQPLLSVNCTALPDSLLESELFGHKKGSFTGAVSEKKGLFEAADGGTIFLDEIGDITPKLQAELLRVLDNGEIKPVGGTVPVKVDVRLIAATNKDLERGIKEGWFRKDLFYRLNVFTVTMPPLRNRLEAVKELAYLFLERTGRRIKKNIVGIDEHALEALKKYSWPGNVRELQNVIERAAVLASDGVIRPENLPANFKEFVKEDPEMVSIPQEKAFRLQRDNHLTRVEKDLIKSYLQETGGNVSLAARKAGVPRRTFYRLLTRYDIQGSEFREKTS